MPTQDRTNSRSYLSHVQACEVRLPRDGWQSSVQKDVIYHPSLDPFTDLVSQVAKVWARMTNVLTKSGKWISSGKWLASAGLHEMTRISSLLTGSVRSPTVLVRIAHPCFHHLKFLCILICRYAHHTECRLAKDADDLETWFPPPALSKL